MNLKLLNWKTILCFFNWIKIKFIKELFNVWLLQDNLLLEFQLQNKKNVSKAFDWKPFLKNIFILNWDDAVFNFLRWMREKLILILVQIILYWIWTANWIWIIHLISGQGRRWVRGFAFCLFPKWVPFVSVSCYH